MRIITFDLGGSSIKSAVVDENYTLSERKKYALEGETWDQADPDAFVLTGIHTADDFAAAIVDICNQNEQKLDGIAFSYNCPADHTTGQTFRGGSNFRFLNNCNYPELFAKYTDLPVSVAKDGNCQLMAELGVGSLRGMRNALTFGIGTCISCGIFVNGDILMGRDCDAGEVSTILLEHNELFGFKMGVRTLIEMVSEACGLDPYAMNGYKTIELVKNGDERAVEAFRSYAGMFAKQMYNFNNIFNPEAIAIGGGISAATVLIDEIRNQYRIINENSYFPKRPPQILPSVFANDSNLIGAAAIFRRYVRKEEVRYS